ncbi:D-hexose-6-phosphate mutarotase [Mangrovimicrobium sediminis]|uniref:Putative glucose-6-phosphate 1-epimerase n=1 Tax=Mangrovimicrobium sediminis TaxID=2562682 RepID=A0A4Z0M9I3_9GAMM|nr:D-hexose-6-phosphate mutarotase [Haliea sp. SAOS-164]TGD76048.1 D-hexose-6-phosphate mutarotase [Haliea sp. SAOS-164]
MSNSLRATLYQRFEKLPGVRLEQHGQLLALRVENQAASALVFLQGAQLAHYQRQGEHPAIWLSPQCTYQRGKPLRGGVPVCWPWFGDLERNPAAIRRQWRAADAPAHGFARNRDWRLDDVSCPDPERTLIDLSLTVAATDDAAWPLGALLQLHIEVSARLRIELRVSNQAATAFYYSGALHSYYAVSAIDTVRVDGLQRLNYIDCARDWDHGRQHGELAIDGETDRIYHGAWGPIRVIDHGWRRVLHLSSEGSDSAVVWNPWVEKSQRLSDFADDAYRGMLCVETANAGEDFAIVEPGETRRLGFTLRCRPL